jgi:hypothetical protein
MIDPFRSSPSNKVIAAAGQLGHAASDLSLVPGASFSPAEQLHVATCREFLRNARRYLSSPVKGAAEPEPPSHPSLAAVVKTAYHLATCPMGPYQDFMKLTSEVAQGLRAENKEYVREAIGVCAANDQALQDFIRATAISVAEPIKTFFRENPKNLDAQMEVLLAVGFGVHMRILQVATEVSSRSLRESFYRRRVLQTRNALVGQIAEAALQSHPDGESLVEKVCAALVQISSSAPFKEVPGKDRPKAMQGAFELHQKLVKLLITCWAKKPELDKLILSSKPSEEFELQDKKRRSLEFPPYLFDLRGFFSSTAHSLRYLPGAPMSVGTLWIQPGETEELAVVPCGALQGTKFSGVTTLSVTNKGQILSDVDAPAWRYPYDKSSWFSALRREILEALAYAPGLLLSGKLPAGALVIIEPKRLLVGLPSNSPPPSAVGLVLHAQSPQNAANLCLALGIENPAALTFFSAGPLKGPSFEQCKGTETDEPICRYLLSQQWDGTFASYAATMTTFGAQLVSSEDGTVTQVTRVTNEGQTLRVHRSSWGSLERKDSLCGRYIESLRTLRIPLWPLTQHLLRQHSFASIDPLKVVDEW